jgi:hypothetical protein
VGVTRRILRNLDTTRLLKEGAQRSLVVSRSRRILCLTPKKGAPKRAKRLTDRAREASFEGPVPLNRVPLNRVKDPPDHVSYGRE